MIQFCPLAIIVECIGQSVYLVLCSMLVERQSFDSIKVKKRWKFFRVLGDSYMYLLVEVGSNIKGLLLRQCREEI